MNHENVLNILVTAEFLKLDHVYEMAWEDYLEPNFVSVIDACNLDLSQMSSRVTHDIAQRIRLKDLLVLRERPDKLISNVFRHRIDILLAKTTLWTC